MEHTYIFQEGLWVAAGSYLDGNGRAAAVKGHNRVTHGPRWQIESFMQLLEGPGLTFENNYEVFPFGPGADSTLWSSRNPATGPIDGRFFIVDDTILSIYASEDGVFTGSEFFLHLDPDRYLNRGALFQQQKRVSAWSVELVRARTGTA
jgi:hypothetical protein